MNQTIRPTPQAPNPAQLRRTLGCFATGVTVITTVDGDGAPWGITVNSFNAVSLDPPLVLWSLAKDAFSAPVYRAAAGFCVNILSAEQGDMARLFASRDEERFRRIDWTLDALGFPVLPGSVATLSCRAWACHDGGDHDIFLGEVAAAEHGDRQPLAYCQGALGPLAIG